MTNIHKMTAVFMIAAGQTVRDTPTVPSEEEMKLRLNLEFEELKEKAQAMGLEGYFTDKLVLGTLRECVNTSRRPEMVKSFIRGVFRRIKNLIPEDTNIVNLPALFDASRDQNVVWAGTDLCFGMQHIASDGDKEVWRSNMSKFDKTEEDAKLTLAKYNNEGVPVYQVYVNGFIVTKRAKDHKVLKSHNYSEADLAPIIRKAMEIKEPREAKPKTVRKAVQNAQA
jgi:hypothetical protein